MPTLMGDPERLSRLLLLFNEIHLVAGTAHSVLAEGQHTLHASESADLIADHLKQIIDLLEELYEEYGA